MYSTQAAIETLRKNWEAVTQTRPVSEHDFNQYGFPNLTAAEVLQTIDLWIASIQEILDRTTRQVPPDELLIDATLAKKTRDANSHLTGAQSNGFQWLCQSTPCIQLLGEIGSSITTYLRLRIARQKNLLRAMAEEANDALLRVERAAPLADALLEHSLEAERLLAHVKETKNGADEALGELAEAESSIRTIADEVTKVRESLTATKEEAERAKSEVFSSQEQVRSTAQELDETVKAAEQLLETAKNEAEEVDQRIRSARQELETVHGLLKSAIKDVNRQGLSGAFFTQSSKVERERKLWLLTFLVTFIGLIMTSYGFKDDISQIRLQNDYFGVLRYFPFFAPLIWLGWYAARQISGLARIQQDYEFKAATAVAFQGYQREVQITDNPVLIEKLLGTAIENFGENPVRLIDNNEKDHGMPIEQLIESVAKREGVLSRLLDAVKGLAGKSRE